MILSILLMGHVHLTPRRRRRAWDAFGALDTRLEPTTSSWQPHIAHQSYNFNTRSNMFLLLYIWYECSTGHMYTICTVRHHLKIICFTRTNRPRYIGGKCMSGDIAGFMSDEVEGLPRFKQDRTQNWICMKWRWTKAGLTNGTLRISGTCVLPNRK